MNRIPRSPGVIATGVLILLLVLSWAGLVPAHRAFGWMQRSLVGPVFRFVSSWTSADEALENAQLRSALRRATREEFFVRERVRIDDSVAALRVWAARHSEQRILFASVVTQFMEDGRLLIVLDQGERSDVRVGQSVIANDGFLVGRIARVAPEHALVELLTAPGHRFSVRMENGDPSLGLAEGRGEQDMISVGFIPRDTALALGDLVVTSGMDSFVPKNLLMGTVQEIRTDESGPWKKASLLPFFRPTDLTHVGILVDQPL